MVAIANKRTTRLSLTPNQKTVLQSVCSYVADSHTTAYDRLSVRRRKMALLGLYRKGLVDDLNWPTNAGAVIGSRVCA